jgi:hypothetical protein
MYHFLSAVQSRAVSQRARQVVLMTFATYLPEAYSLEVSERYSTSVAPRKPIEDWGRTADGSRFPGYIVPALLRDPPQTREGPDPQ